MKDFLLTMIAFKLDEDPAQTPEAVDQQVKSAIDDQCSLYFHLFDIDDTGVIDLEELKLMILILFKDQHISPAVRNSEELFRVIDLDANDQINYEEFKKFYAGVLTSTYASGMEEI
jgi:Ca2+-binding EF-hand superfamily protein